MEDNTCTLSHNDKVKRVFCCWCVCMWQVHDNTCALLTITRKFFHCCWCVCMCEMDGYTFALSHNYDRDCALCVCVWNEDDTVSIFGWKIIHALSHTITREHNFFVLGVYVCAKWTITHSLSHTLTRETARCVWLCVCVCVKWKMTCSPSLSITSETARCVCVCVCVWNARQHIRSL